MFSVVIPLYNKADYIQKAVASVLYQTYPAFELIVINDGSTEDSLQRVTPLIDPRIYVIDQPNAGVSATRNRGVSLARFEYVAFLDADDWWEPSFLGEMAQLILEYGEANLFGCNYYYVKHGKYSVEPKGLPKAFRAGYIDYISAYGSQFCVLLNCSFVVVRKQAFMQVGGFKSTLRFSEDFDLWIRLALAGKVAYLNTPLAYSNQDVVAQSRAIGSHKLYHPDAHFIFNTGYLKPAEQRSAALKRLLDGLRVRVLLPYYLANEYVSEVQAILAEIDFSQQPLYYQRAYQSPRMLVHLYFRLRQMGSWCKQTLMESRHRTSPATE